MEIIFLGTSQAVPTADRNHTAILVKHEDENILVDCGEGTQRQFRIADINPCRLTKILITHWHGDHILGIPGLLQTLALNNYSKTLEIYGPKGTRQFMHAILNMFIFEGKIKVNVTEVEPGKFFDSRNLELFAYKVEHGRHALAYAIKEKDKLNINIEKLKKMGIKPGIHLRPLKEGRSIKIGSRTIKAKDFTFFRKGKKISIVLDTAYCDSCIAAAKDADLLISDSTYASDLKEKAREYEHLTAEDAGRIAKKAKVKELILSHISQRYKNKEEILLKEAKRIFKNTKIARDFMRVQL
jgi:ribonuclease Z